MIACMHTRSIRIHQGRLKRKNDAGGPGILSLSYDNEINIEHHNINTNERRQ